MVEVLDCNNYELLLDLVSHVPSPYGRNYLISLADSGVLDLVTRASADPPLAQKLSFSLTISTVLDLVSHDDLPATVADSRGSLAASTVCSPIVCRNNLDFALTNADGCGGCALCNTAPSRSILAA